MIASRCLLRPLLPQIARVHGRNMAHASIRNPLITVVGATGTGKSELAIELAIRFNGEIINGDAMQMYRGLPIITNQVPESERKGVPHHLLGIVGTQEEPWRVGVFVRKALEVIEDIKSRGKIPILVGGTHYYTQSLLFEDKTTVEGRTSGDLTRAELISKYPILEESTQVIYDRLMEVDPIMANRWHPNDRRKIQRSLEIYLTTGRKASDIYNDQRQQDPRSDEISKENTKKAGARFDSLVFWIHVPRPILTSRLDKRVDKMLESGLLAELETMDKFLKEQREEPDKSRGIWAAIGYHEFQEYQTALSDQTVDMEDLDTIKIDAIEKMRAHNRQYASRQIRWIQSKLLSAFSRAKATDKFFLLDGSILDKWQQEVRDPATRITEDYLKGAELLQPTDLSELAAEMLSSRRDDFAQRPDLWIRQTCETCSVTAVTQKLWEQHLGSRSHRRAIKQKSKEEQKAEAGPESEDAASNDSLNTFPINVDTDNLRL